jgi:hypothetical protein
MGGGTVEITAEMIEQARQRGACKSALERIKPGDSVESLDREYLAWIDESGMWTIDACTALVADDPVLICGTIPAVLFSAYGYAYGYGYGDGYGYGCGYGSGYGDGYGYGCGDGDGYGYGYGCGDGYGYGYGYGDGYGYGYGDGDGCGYGYGCGYGKNDR